MTKPKINILVAGENLLGIKNIINILENTKDLEISGKLTDEKQLQDSVKSINAPLVLYHSLDLKKALKTIESLDTLNVKCKFIGGSNF